MLPPTAPRPAAARPPKPQIIPADAKTIVLGEYGSMTGALATFGQSTDNAVKMATEEINAKGGVLGKPVEISLEDDGSRAEQVPLAVNKLINEKNVSGDFGRSRFVQ